MSSSEEKPSAPEYYRIWFSNEVADWCHARIIDLAQAAGIQLWKATNDGGTLYVLHKDHVRYLAPQKENLIWEHDFSCRIFPLEEKPWLAEYMGWTPWELVAGHDEDESEEHSKGPI